MAGSFNTIYSLIYPVLSGILYNLPMGDFSVLYVTICNQIRSEILSFEKLLSSSQDYERLLQTYSNIKSTVEIVDDHTSFLIFGNIVHNSLAMYIFMHTLLNEEAANYYKFYEIIFFFLITFSTFIAVTVSASMVTEASLMVASKSRSLPIRTLDSQFVLQRLLLCLEKEIYFTVWKIVPIRRNFIVGTMGAVLTYVVLFHSLDI
ncbi:uncharacterized protein TNIN_378681 [Trichonephila inaurata madagascariensis]|uniref:Gustatory receptor n=1 Tax=Trichonephila inaurata madagascariensis TaxID=2747483 RepID=A0A8X6YK27_9ARAC|nr:uncharacterized protein TNIN_358901 [Trichonephila inaurata madagascariensis]GFY72315.1 uncharacterized protein TNIN_378681 [Trichonephila inaurata madagascariensis]